MRVKVYGERNTGTQMMRQILAGNCVGDLWPGTVAELGAMDRVTAAARDDRPEADRLLIREAVIDDIFADAFERTLGWKHGIPDMDRLTAAATGTHFVVTVKNPYAWVVSMARRPHHNVLTGNRHSIEAFLDSPWITCGRDNAPRHLASVIDLWTLKYRAWLALEARWPVTVVRYEDLLLQDTTLAFLANRLDPGAQRPWQLPTEVPNNPNDLAFYRDYYSRERWREALPARCIDLIGSRLDHELMDRLGYPVLSGSGRGDHGAGAVGGSGETANPAAS